MASPLDAFLASIRKRCLAGTWSLGVKMARAGAVLIESRNDEEIVLRVQTPGRLIAPTVVLYPGERETDCDCGSKLRVCEHVAAAAIALGQGEGAGDGEPQDDDKPKPLAVAQKVWGRVVYRFSKDEGGLRLSRAIVRAGAEPVTIDTTLSAILSQPGLAGTVQPEESDLLADRLLETGARGVLQPSKLDALLRVLAGSPRLILDGRPIAFEEDEVPPTAVVEERGEDIVVTLARDPRVTEVVSPGVAVCGDALHRLGELDLCGGWLQNLPQVRVYTPKQFGEVVTKVLPDLHRRMMVDVRSRRLPRVVRDLPPHVVVELNHLGQGLSAMATLVYGAPPCARIDNGAMTYLRGPVPIRDEPEEQRLLHRLRSALDLLPGRRMTFEGPDAIRFADKLKRWKGALTGDAAGSIGSQARLRPQLRIHSEAGTGDQPPGVRFDLDFAVEGGTGGTDGGTARTVDGAAVIRAWQEGLGLVPLDGGGWAPLPQAWLDKHGQRVADLLAARTADGRLSTHALPTLAPLCEDLNQPPPPGLDRLAPLFEEFDRLPEAKLPGDLTATLRPYQREGANWLAFLRGANLGGILADDMGLGKTLQTLCVLQRNTLVVCPTSVLHNWKAEIARFRPTLTVNLYHGPGRALDKAADVTLTSYALLRLDAERLQAHRWSAVVLDEAQAIKNPDSQAARAAYALNADFRLALTGTPVENRLDELWSLAHFTNRGLLGGRSDFDERFGRAITSGDAGAASALRKRLRPFMLRRLKRDVAPDLPPRTESTLRVALTERERAIYDAVRAASRAEVVALLTGGGSVIKALEALLRLRQAACHPALVPGQTATTSSKIEALMEAMENAAADGHKALVFSQWTSLLNLIEPALKEAGVAFTRLDGSTRDREEVVTRFQSPDGPPVMLVSLKAGGTGLNLTAADHVFLCDPWWNPAVEEQAADRAHRIGQDRPVFVYRLATIDTVEERILELQEKKRAIAQAAVGEGAGAANLTRDDLLALLE